jgi:hypothetical protein
MPEADGEERSSREVLADVEGELEEEPKKRERGSSLEREEEREWVMLGSVSMNART